MSHSISKFSAHGFCEAIFSTSPAECNKENKTPVKKIGKTSCLDIFNEQTPVSKKQSQSKHKSTNVQCTNHRQYTTCNLQMEPLSRSSTTYLNRSKSVNMLHKSDPIISGNLILDDRQKTPTKVRSSSIVHEDETPIMHLYTPKQMKASNNMKADSISTPKTPMKRYFSDHALSQAAPECFNIVQVDTPYTKINNETIEEQTLYEGETSNLTVGIRIRPLSSKELTEAKISKILHLNGQNITVDCESSQHTFTYDHCFISHADSTTPGHASQETVFKNMVLPLVQTAFEGYNVCLFAYGQTGSGKSYSMMGKESCEASSTVIDDEAGIIPRFCQEIFTKAARNQHITTKVEISYFEIYNENIHDLLTNVNNGIKKPALKVREHPEIGPYVVDLSQHSVNNYKDLQTWLKVGKSQRATAATGMNEKSSRSHSIFSIILKQTQSDCQSNSKSMDTSRCSKINLVDLAGSERLSQTCASGDRLREGVSINKSLLTLGKVIASLSENIGNRKRGFVPYRESNLTWLLKESLGGNSRTVMLGTVSPANIHVEETLATLRYACQARAIVNRIRINDDPNVRTIRELKEELLRLRGVYERQLGVVPRRLADCIDPIASTHDGMQEKQKEIDRLKEQLRKTEEQLASTQTTWQEKLREADEKKNSELRYLRRCGIAVEIDLHEQQKQPCLMNLAADPMLSGTLLYLIPPGLVRIGKSSGVDNLKCAKSRLDIVLDGPLVRQLHCTIENNNGKLLLLPEMNGDTYVNGQIVIQKCRLKHGDRLVIGGNHYFKILNPHDKSHGTTISQVIDFEFAHKEILKVQEEKLRTELEESKQKAIKELEYAKREVELQLGSQRTTYEHKIEVLGLTLEEQKLALEEINRKKKELELEKEVLVNEVETNKRIRTIQQEEIKINVSPYKSNFLQELEGILNEQTADAETALKMKMSEDAIVAGGITLHEMQLLVREATERCREFGLNYEFRQQQIIVDKALEPVIRVRDRDRMIETFWQPLPFLDWVHRLRDHDIIEDSIKELRDTDTSWDAYEDSEVFEESMNSSRISINMTPLKKHLNESLHQLSMDASSFEYTVADQTSNSNTSDLNKNVNACLTQIELATKTLGKLYKLCNDQNITFNVSRSLDRVQSIIHDLRNIVEIRDTRENDDKSTSLLQSLDDTVIEKFDSEKLILSNQNSNQTCANLINSPCKSNLRNTDLYKGGNASKSVRFTDAIKQSDT